MSINYAPQPGATITWVVPGPGTAFPSNTNTHLNPEAGNPFGSGAGGALNLAVHRARYGTPPVNEAGTEGVFQVYAEAIGTLSRALNLAATDHNNAWGLSAGPNVEGEGVGFATQLELNDFAACECPQGRRSAVFSYLGEGGGGSVRPGQPAIIAISSVVPGVVILTWRTRSGHTKFEVKVGDVAEVVEVTDASATTFTEVVELPVGVGGLLSATVTAYIGNTPGNPSLPQTVHVVPLTDDDEPPPPPPPVSDKLSDDAQATVRDMVTVWPGKVLGINRVRRLQQLADELIARELV